MARLAARDGLHAVTLRGVASEAGVLRLVQYYFQSKSQLIHAALLSLERQSQERLTARLRLPNAPSARRTAHALLAEALPTDEPSRRFHLVWTAHAMLAMTDGQLSAQSFVDGPDRFEGQLAEELRRAVDEGELMTGLDVSLEAARLLSLRHGLGTTVLVGQRDPRSASAVLGYHLDQLFRPGAPG